MKHSALLIATAVVCAFSLAPLCRADDPNPASVPVPANYPNANLIPADAGPNGPASQPTGKEWPKPTAAQFDEGKRIFQNRCARCHGWGMVNLGSISFDLRQFPHDDAVRFFHDVRYGKNAMPSWRDILTTEEMANVWAYVRTGGKQ